MAGYTGYAGLYKGVLLRSSYEYAYAKFLDSKNVDWRYEEILYDLANRNYKPDFFVYDNSGKFLFVVEIKPTFKAEIEIAKRDLNDLKKMYDVDGYLITNVELKDIYFKCMEKSFYATTKAWREDKNNAVYSDRTGSSNAHYGIKHSEHSKKMIGNTTKARWKTNLRSVMHAGSIKGSIVSKRMLTGVHKKPREDRTCPKCSKTYSKIVTSKQLYCSQRCSYADRALEAVTVRWHGNRQKHDEIRGLINSWCCENRQLVLNTPFNKISTNFNDLLCLIESKFGIKDIRICIKAYLGKEGNRKEFLMSIKQMLS